MGVPRAPARTWELWLDLRTSEVTFAQMVVVKLFYSVRRVIDEAGKALPQVAASSASGPHAAPSHPRHLSFQGAGVQGLLFAEPRFDPADTIGLELPVFVEAPDGKWPAGARPRAGRLASNTVYRARLVDSQTGNRSQHLAAAGQAAEGGGDQPGHHDRGGGHGRPAEREPARCERRRG